MSLAYTHALTRAPSPAYPALYPDIAIDLDLARRQHAAYVAALRDSGLSVRVLDGVAAMPDCVFVEDTAILWERNALMARPSPRRAGEAEAMAPALAETHAVTWAPEGVKLEGGDVLQTDGHVFVGLTDRTDEAGAEALRAFMAPLGRPVVAVPVTRCLHLKTAATYLGGGAVALSPDLLDAEPFARAGYAIVEANAPAGNAIRAGATLLTMRADEPDLAAFARQHGLKRAVLDTSEFEKGDGALTCLSLLWG